MSMLHTIQNSYFPLRSAEVTSAEVPLDGTTAGSNLWDMSSRDRVRLSEDVNGLCVYFAGEMADGDQGTCHMYGQAKGGPAEKLAEISLTAGLCFYEGAIPGEATGQVDVSTYLFVDTIAIDTTNKFHIKDIEVYDSANNRPCRMQFDTAGFEYIYFCFSAIPGTRIAAYGRGW